MYENATGGAISISPTGEARFGGIAGTAQGNARFENVLVKGAVTTSGSNTIYAGGLVGLMKGTSRIYNAYGGLNLTVNNSGSDISVYVGGVAGSMGEITGDNSGGSAVKAEEITIVGDITVSITQGAYAPSTNNTTRGLHIGGLTGMLYGLSAASNERAELKDVDYKQGTIMVTIGTTRSSVGGAVGTSFDFGNITNCTATPSGFIINKGPNGTQFRVGGFIGEFAGTGKVENCFSDTPVVVNNNDFTGSMLVGGFAGRLASDISYCYAKGNVRAHGRQRDGVLNFYVGGFVGEVSSGSISYCYSSGDVNAVINPIAVNSNVNIGIGGFAGRSYNVNNSYALGNVSLDYSSTSTLANTINIGGLIGLLSGSVNNCFATGSVVSHRDIATGTVNTGGLVGNASTYSVTNSAALGASITATGGETRNVGRIYGSTNNTGKNNNRALNEMQLFQHATYKFSNLTVETISGTHNNQHGQNATDVNFRRRDIWQNVAPVSGAPSAVQGLGFDPAYWDFSTVQTRGYPILKGVNGVGLLGGQ